MYINSRDDVNNPLSTVSKKQNPLAFFKSYSYYHALVMCDSADTADALSSSNTNVVDHWLHPHIPDEKTGRFFQDGQTKYTPQSISTKNGPGQYCVIINGATDADVVITKLQFMTLTSAGASNNDRNTSLAVEGTMEISEPKGIMFMDTLVRCANSLGRDPANVVFMIKTFFVGFNDDDRIETITYLTPMRFIITDVSGSFTESGGEYKIEFVATSNGATRLPQYNKLNMSVPLKGGTLSEVVTTIQKNIDTSYDKMFKCVTKQVEFSEKDLGYDNKELSKSLRKVKYKMELDNLYQGTNYKFTPSHQQGGDKTCDDKGHTTTGTDFSFESALHMMMQHCARVELDSKEGILTEIKIAGRTYPVGTKMQYKIHSKVKPLLTVGEYSHEVTYKVKPFPVPKDLISMASGSTPEDQANAAKYLEPETMYFSYLYTGENVDILEFDMKMNMGLAYMQMATVTNSLKTQGETAAAKVTVANAQTADQSARRVSIDGRPVTIPVFFSTNLELPNQRSVNNAPGTAGSTWNMAKQGSIEMLDVSMKITGNLLLLNSALSATEDDTENTHTDQIPNLSWGSVPSFAKVRIMMPASNDDIALFSDKTKSFTTQFWYDGYYYIMGAEHVFADGEFTQNLQMLSMPKPPDGAKRGDTAQKSAFSSDVADCYNGGKCADAAEASAGKTQSSANAKSVADSPSKKQAEAIATPASPVQLPANPIDNVVSTMSPDNVKGWDKMPANVKSAITQEVSGDRIPLSTYAAIAAIESNGNPGAVSTTGAVGIFQFTKGTWNEVMPNNKVTDGNDPRRDANLNARASRLYLNKISKTLGGTTEPTWLYMGHNLGPGAARAVMNESKAGNCRPMESLYAAHPNWKPQWASFAKANGYAQDSTTCNLRDQIAGKYAKRIKDINNTDQATTPSQPTPATTPSAPVTTKQTTPRTAGQQVNNVSRRCAPPKDDKKTAEEKKAEEKKPKDCGTDKQPTQK